MPQFEAALKINKAYPEAENNLGQALATLGRLNEGAAAFRRRRSGCGRKMTAHRCRPRKCPAGGRRSAEAAVHLDWRSS